MSHAVNSRDWWNEYFTWQWDAHVGRGQTRHFMERLLANLPDRELQYIGSQAPTILDWGCAFGEGAALLSQAFPKSQVTGLDFSIEAISAARARYPSCEFLCTAEGQIPRDFDVILTSNCLEHFKRPLRAAQSHLAHCRMLYVVLVPYKEEHLHETHVAHFDDDSFPERLGDFIRLHAAPIEVDAHFWPGRQLLVVYGSPMYLDDLRGNLAHITPIRQHAQDAVSSDAAQTAEREKWDKYYETLPVIEEDPITRAFGEEFARRVQAIVPAGSKTLEAGCGAGWHSLALARTGKYSVSLLDFSSQALSYARRIYAHAGVAADQFLQGYVFDPGKPEYDLVFNAGVLEHYTFDEQVAFLKGMASRSRNYVLVLVPNKLCYWYWLWRIHQVGSGQWPFGKEVPLVDMEKAFEASGMTFLGQAFMGANWAESFIQGLPGMDETLRHEILEVHRSAVEIPEEQKSYLVAFLGSVEPASARIGRLWKAAPTSELMRDAEINAMLADALSLQIGAENQITQLRAEMANSERRAQARIAELQREFVELQRKLAEREQEMQARIAELAQAVEEATERHQELLAAQHERFQQQIAARDDTYRAEIERTLAQAAMREAALRAERDQQEANVTSLYRTKVVRAMAAYWKLRSDGINPLDLVRSSARAAYRGVVPHRLRRELWYRRNTGRGYKDSQEAREVRREEQRKRTSTWEGLQPAAVTASATPLGVTPAACDGKPTGVARGPDIICFPVIDWDFRFQRPQQVLSQFARAGHRGYYLNTKFAGMHETAVRTRAIGERLCELFLPGDTDIIIYKDRLSSPTLRKALVALQEYAQQECICDAVLIVQHPFWAPLAEALREASRWKIVYDCMDDHSGFSDNSPEVLAQEDHLVRASDLVITTSRLLQDKMSQRHTNVVLVPNASDYLHFRELPIRLKSPIAQLPRPVIGYYGAIAEWFDVAAMAEATACHPEWSFVLIGHTVGADLAALEKCPNVHLLGEKPYAELPGYVAGFDVCTIPFRRIPLTEATNPVKLFEYLATGKPVVARRLPEIESYAETVALYDTPAEFVAHLEDAIASTAASTAPQPMRARQAVARENTWAARYKVFAGAIKRLYGRVSVIIVSYNNLELMQHTLASTLEKTHYPNYEVIVVDNGSEPEVTDYLEEMAAEYPDQITVVLNGRNLGFAAANNIGITMATASEYVVLLNNDVIVTPGWLTTLIRHLDNEQIGIVGPVTNSCGNEARIEVDYADLSGIDAFAARYTRAHAGQIFDIGVLAMYCVALRRAVVDEIGLLDEIFGVGMFEDDDYALRIRAAGYRVVCAEDVFIHHFWHASFAKMENEAYKRLFEENKRLFKQKWNRTWKPHRYRPQKEMGLLSRALAGARRSR